MHFCIWSSDRYKKNHLIIIFHLLTVLLFGLGVVFCAPVYAQTSISSFYGFEDIQIVKFDSGIGNLRTADLNQDGLNDIILVNNRRSKIEFLLRQSDTASTGEPEQIVSQDWTPDDINELPPPAGFARTELLVSAEISSLVVGDFNRDQLPDLAHLSRSQGLFIQYQQNKTQGDFTLVWSPREKIPVVESNLNFPEAMRCEDINLDGLDDLLVVSDEKIYILFQKSDGGFDDPIEYPTLGSTRSLTIGDVNADSKKDLILISTGDYPIRIRFGLNGGTFGPQRQFEVPPLIDCELYGPAGSPNRILAIDRTSGRLNIFALEQNGSNLKSDQPAVLFYPLPNSSENRNRQIVLADFDGNGQSDLIVSSPESAELILYLQSDQGFSEPRRFPAFTSIDSMSAADVDCDGDMELALLSVQEKTIGITRYDGSRLTFPSVLAVRGEPLAMQLEDMDGDGKVDCCYITSDESGKRTFYIRYDISQNDQESQPYSLALEKLVSNPSDMRIADFDKDGLKDILVFVQFSDPIVLSQTTPGQFEVLDKTQTQSGLLHEASLRSTGLADVDQDGFEELILARQNFARALTMTPSHRWKVIDQFNSSRSDALISAVAVGDVLGEDSDPEILLLNAREGKLEILSQAQDKTWRFERMVDVHRWEVTDHLAMITTSPGPDHQQQVLLFDGQKFAVVPFGQAAQNQQAYIQYKMQHERSFETSLHEGAYGRIAVGDINSSGTDDIILVESRNHHIEILSVVPETGSLEHAMRFRIFEQKSYEMPSQESQVEPRELIVADVTGDGAEDLVTIIHDRVIIYPQDAPQD